MKHLILLLTVLFFSAGANAQTGNVADSLYNLGNKCFNLRKYKEAVKYYRQAADNGNIEAAWKTVQCYYHECGVTYSYDKVHHYMQIAAEGGNKEAMTALGNFRYRSDKYSEALKWYSKAEELGDCEAMLNIGNMYALGKGVPQDNEKAVEWWEKAAENDNVNAQATLGRCYLFGNGGVTVDKDKAEKWLRKAADSDDAESAYYLASHLETFYGDEANYVDVAYYYMVAANQGHADAQASLGLLYWEGKGVEKSQKKAAGWYIEAASNGSGIGMYNAAYCYYLGKGVKQDKEKAKQYFKAAAALGVPNAKEILEKI